MVWCALREFLVLVPYFFKDARLQNFLQPQLAADVEDIWFQQDGATVHTAQRTMRYQRERFPRHIISQCSDILWPAWSPDLALSIFFLWGYLKREVHKHHPCNLVKLKLVIREEIQQVTLAMTMRVMRNFR